MSEKHGQLSGAQWTTKSSAAAAGNTTKHQQPNPSSNTIYEATATVATSPYGIGAVPVPGPISIPDIPTYTSGRFQAPPIHMHPAKSSPLTIVTPPQPILQPQVSPTTTTNVPVPSGGFVPPTFPNMTSPGSGAGTGGATSVLTPNPFAAAAGNPGLAFVNAFNFSNAQQLELGKIMHAMNASSPAATTLPRHPQAAHPHPSHNHPSEGGPVVAPTAAPSGAINSTIAENVMNALSSDEDRMRRVQQVIEASLE